MIPSVKSYNKDFSMEEYVESTAITRYLVTFFEIIEEESCVSHVKDYPLHGMSQFC